jgi:hypothetical protein
MVKNIKIAVKFLKNIDMFLPNHMVWSLKFCNVNKIFGLIVYIYILQISENESL